MSVEHGTITAVEEDPLGDELAKDYAAGAGVIEVRNLADFPEFGGSLTLPGETIAYDQADWDASTILLSAPTALDHSAEDPVLLDPPVKRYVAHVHIDDVAGEVVLADLSHALKMYLPLGTRDVDAGESVVISNETGTWSVIDVLGVLPVLIGGAIFVPDEDGPVFSVDTDGHLTARTARVHPKDATAVALTVYDDVGTDQNLIEIYVNGDILTSWVTNGGAFASSGARFAYYADPSDAEPKARFGETDATKAGLQLGPGGFTLADTNLYRNSAGVLKTDGQLRAVDGVETIYISGAGKTNAADGDFVAVPGDGTTAVVMNSTTGDVYFCVRANGAWKAHGPL